MIDISQTGTSISATAFRASDRRRVELRAESDVFADSMEAAGIAARIKNRDVSLVGQVTGGVKEASPYRNLTLIPEVAARVRAVQEAVVEAFKDHIGKAQAQQWHYAVVSSGARINPGESIKYRHSEITKRITAFFRYDFEEFGVELLIRATEYPLDAEHGWSVHLHHNVIFWPHRELSSGEWARFRADASEKFGVEWYDGGKVTDPMRAVKYALKRPKISPEMPPEVLRWLAGELGRMKLVAFYNGLKNFSDSHRHQKYQYDHQARRKIWIDKDARKPRGPKVQGDTDAPTSAPEQSFQPDSQHEASEALILTESEGAQGGDASAGGSVTAFPAPAIRAPWRAEEPENVMLGQTRVMLLASAWRESYLIVKNYQPNPRTRAGQERLAKILALQAEARAIWDKNGAPPPEVALSISLAWLAAASDQEAEKITLPDFNVHSATLSVENNLPSSIVIPSIPDSPPLHAHPPISPPRPLPDRATRDKFQAGRPFDALLSVEFPILIHRPPVKCARPLGADDDVFERMSWFRTDAYERHQKLTKFWIEECEPWRYDEPLEVRVARFNRYRDQLDAWRPGLDGPVPKSAINSRMFYPGLQPWGEPKHQPL